jgi:hypothetical protein
MILPINRSLVGARVERISSARACEMCLVGAEFDDPDPLVQPRLAGRAGWVDHPIGSQLGALGALRPGLFDRLGDMRFSEVFVADLCQKTSYLAAAPLMRRTPASAALPNADPARALHAQAVLAA